MLETLRQQRNLADAELISLLETDCYDARLFQQADQVRRQIYGQDVYLRGLIEISNFCRNNCYYCGIRGDNPGLARYRLTPEEILECCAQGYGLGFRTFVLQGGEDSYYHDDLLCRLLTEIKTAYPDCAVTLSLGEKSRASYAAFFRAGADRYLLRQETANFEHYRLLHPASMSPENRRRCLWDLKELGYQVGAGFMVGSPYQTTAHLVEDLRFLQKLQPAMIGIGPYLSHRQTPFHLQPDGGLELTLRLLAILRLMFPGALLPATTALGTIDPQGRERGLLAGANVVMPNLSPERVRPLYALYDHKLYTGEEAAEGHKLLIRQVEAAGYKVTPHRGDAKPCPPAPAVFAEYAEEGHGLA